MVYCECLSLMSNRLLGHGDRNSFIVSFQRLKTEDCKVQHANNALKAGFHGLFSTYVFTVDKENIPWKLKNLCGICSTCAFHKQ